MKKKNSNLIRKLKNKWKNDPIDILVPIVSFLILIISSFTIGILKGIIIFVIINCIYFIPSLFKNKDKTKEISTPTGKKKKRRKKLKIFLLFCLICFILGIIAVVIFLGYIVVNAPDFDPNALEVSEPSIYLDKNGNEIGKVGKEKRVPLEYDEIPDVLIDAIVATEDSRFFEHRGVDWARFLKATMYQLLGQSGAGGASTLTMQISKNAYTSDEATGFEGIKRKFTDVYVSMFIIEKEYTKNDIMKFYVNSQWLAKNSYGVEQTSLMYFGKSAKELNLAEAAMIAGLFQAPGVYDPYKNPEATENRRQTVLKLMLRHGYITKDEYNIAKVMTVEKIVVPKEQSSYGSGEVSKYQSFIDTVAEEVVEKTGKSPFSTSMVIHTTLDPDLQDHVNEIMNAPTNGTEEAKGYKGYTWADSEAKAGIAVINIKDGSVAALGGNRNVQAVDTFNYATDLKNQIGSTAKPLYDYAPAIEYHNWSSYNIVTDEPITYTDGTKINNWNGKFEGFETARVALRGSRNIPALKAFKQNDKAKIIELVTNLGLTPEIYSCNEGYTRHGKECLLYDEDGNIKETIAANKANTLHEAHAIGGYNGESPLTMAAAYSAFANGGTYTEPYTFTKIVYQDTNEEYLNDTIKTKAMSEETAYIISDMLVTTAPNAVGGYYNINGIKYAAKTGTTNFDDKTMKAKNLPANTVNDLWTVGFNTEYAIGVWYGYDPATREHRNILSSGQHNRLFQAVGKKVFTNRNGFTKPNGVVSVEVEAGCPVASLPSEFTPEGSDYRQTELFIKGTEPTTVSTRFAKLNDVNNLKGSATGNTVTLTWDAVPVPEINTEEGLKKYFSSVFETEEYLNSHVAGRLNWNKSHIGTLGYNVYKKNADGSLQLLDFVSTNKYETTINTAGDCTFVVKTSYSIFKNNMSDGKSVNVNISDTVLPPIPDNPDNPNNPENPDNPDNPDSSNPSNPDNNNNSNNQNR